MLISLVVLDGGPYLADRGLSPLFVHTTDLYIVSRQHRKYSLRNRKGTRGKWSYTEWNPTAIYPEEIPCLRLACGLGHDPYRPLVTPKFDLYQRHLLVFNANGISSKRKRIFPKGKGCYNTKLYG